jgi:hypothetical protein
MRVPGMKSQYVFGLLAAGAAVALAAAVQLSATQVVTHGSYKKLTIGEPKDRVLANLRLMQVSSIWPDVIDPPRAQNVGELNRLRSAEGIIVAAGAAKFQFSGEAVSIAMIAPYPQFWTQQFAGANTRSEVFRRLEDLMRKKPGTSARAGAVDARWVKADAPGTDGIALLHKYALWRGHYKDEEGNCNVTLSFAADSLTRIEALCMNGELP